ncbi:MAG: hypothetical protein LC780_00845 [Acidobacteria bacterium]|nr:hypothetical protein [Acidobacteriota bacterium]
MSSSRLETKAIRRPSGFQTGEESDALLEVSRRGRPPASGTIQRSPFPRFSSTSYVVTV